MKRLSEKGFVLPVAIMLMIVLTISGAGFFQFLFHEFRMTMNEVDNHGGFYLANAGVERARESFKFDLDAGVANWTPILAGNYDADADGFIDYPIDLTPDIDLCPDPAGLGCIIPSFQTNAKNPSIASDGAPVTSPDFPLQGTFDGENYNVRAFNNLSDAGGANQDTDSKLTVRARGRIRGEEKIIQADIKAASGVKLINCEGTTGSACPEDINGNDNLGECDETTTPECNAMDGREPAASPELPAMTFPLTDSNNYYRDLSNFPSLTLQQVPGGTKLSDTPNGQQVQLLPNVYYYSTGSIEVVSSAGTNNVMIVSLTNVSVKSALLTDAIIVGVQEVSLQGGATIHAPLPYPAIIAGTAVHADNNVNVSGNVFSAGLIDLNPLSVQGVLIGDEINIQGAAVFSDNNDIAYYAFMPGFTYPESFKTTKTVTNTWREVK